MTTSKILAILALIFAIISIIGVVSFPLLAIAVILLAIERLL